MTFTSTLPDMSLPFPATCCSDIDLIERDAVDWAALRMDPAQLGRIRKTKAGRVVARTASRAAPREFLDAYAHFVVWGFWFDDLFVDDAEPDAPMCAPAIASMLDILDTGVGTGAAGKEVEDVFAEVLDELGALLTSAQMIRWQQEVRTWFCSMAFQNAMRQQTPTVEAYKALRRYSVCAYPCLVLIEASHGDYTGYDDWQHPQVAALRVRCVNQVAWSNDVFSYHMEKDHPGGFWNLPTVYQAHGLSEQEALERTAADVATETHAFVRQETSGPRLTAGQQCCVDSMRSWMSGCLDWHREAADRYTGWASDNDPAGTEAYS